ncbi:hypothetical protein [Aurantimonas sp. 22II-16-19i]|uniref:hypothetical protein n=1 Tax=Aurantimonas sp. 22II-16-19i TaxID=1317114 RepID=UPI00111BF6CC|nr:hypothetical protein [Aurantimonas sp. 22II-16-19i]
MRMSPEYWNFHIFAARAGGNFEPEGNVGEPGPIGAARDSRSLPGQHAQIRVFGRLRLPKPLLSRWFRHPSFGTGNAKPS